jgi:exodeoxyribonuclease VII large subunit
MAKGKGSESQLGLFGQQPAGDAPRKRRGERPPRSPEPEPEPEPTDDFVVEREPGWVPPPMPKLRAPVASEASRAQAAEPQPSRPMPSRPEPEVLTVARLDHLLRRVVEGATTNVLVQGEVSGLHRAGSGHVYFSLKDLKEDALIDCVMYRTASMRARNALRDGERVVLSGRVTLYAPRGRLQLIADNVLQTQRGALLEALERLKKKLAAEGLFDAGHKKPMPADPRRIAVLTSRAGAAIHDVIRVAFRRGHVQLLLVPTPVQGFGAAERIARAIAFTDRLGLDAMIVTRGGGSAEDLAAYNEEAVVRAIAGCRTPVLSAVGHEVDVSLSDLVADARAATPSQAAEILVPDDRERRQRLEHLEMRMARAIRHRIVAERERCGRLWAAIEEPRRLLRERSQRFDELSSRMERTVRRTLVARRGAVEGDLRRLQGQHPRRVTAETRRTFSKLEPRIAAAMRERLVAERRRLAEIEPRLVSAIREDIIASERKLAELAPRAGAAMTARLKDDRGKLENAVARLDAMSPLSVLSRGYAIATDEDGHVITDASETSAGDRIRIRLHQGTVKAVVEDRDGDG